MKQPPPPPSKPTLRQIAQAAGVSIATASRILNGPGRHSFTAQTVQRVQDAAHELAYGKRAAVSPRRRRRTPGAIAYLYSGHFTDPAMARPGDDEVLGGVEFFSNLLVGVQQAVSQLGCRFDMICDLQHEQTQINHLNQLLRQRIGGVLLSGLFHESALEFIRRHRIPALYVGDGAPPIGRLSCLHSDNSTGGFLAARHLIQAGHRRIAFVGDFRSEHAQFNRVRLGGYLQALAAAGIEPDERLLVSAEQVADLREPMRRLAALKSPPTAAFTGTQGVAINLLKVFEDLRWPVPRRMSLVTFDNTSISDYTNPPLTAINVPRVLLGRQAIHRLVELIANPDQPPLTTLIPVSLVERESVAPGPFARAARRLSHA
jgi:LacI family transcriptional regulator